MKNVARYAGLAAIAVGIFCALIALPLALASICGEGAAICRPSADGTPWLVNGFTLIIAGAAALGWGDA